MAVAPGDGHTMYVASLDVGSSGVRCHIYDRQARVCGTASQRLRTECPSTGVFEVDPEHLWQAAKDTIRTALKGSSVSPSSVKALGISTQRATFACWDKSTGQLLHKFISWKDTRAESLCREWNSSARVKAMRMGASFLYCLTHKDRYLAGSMLRFESGLVVMRLLWALKNIPGLREGAREGRVLMGTVDSFLLWRLTGGRVHATDPSNACITGLFDPFTMEWSRLITDMLDIPVSMLPRVLSTSDVFGVTDPDILGAEIPIACLAGDQQASAFGECCFLAGDVKCTMGTGTFFNANTADQPHASTVGIYPVVGWKIRDQVTYLAEGGSFDTGTVIDWAQEMGLINNADESAEVAESVDSSAGVFFIPAFSGLQAPVNDAYAAAGFLGLSTSTRPAHMVRAMLESLAFRAYQLHALLKGTSGLPAIGTVSCWLTCCSNPSSALHSATAVLSALLILLGSLSDSGKTWKICGICSLGVLFSNLGLNRRPPAKLFLMNGVGLFSVLHSGTLQMAPGGLVISDLAHIIIFRRQLCSYNFRRCSLQTMMTLCLNDDV